MEQSGMRNLPGDNLNQRTFDIFSFYVLHMKKLTALTFLLLIFSLSSCNRKHTESNWVALIKTEKTLSFPLDSETKSLIVALFPYTDSEGKEFLTFQNERKNEILFYEMNSGKFLYKIKPAREGPDGIGRLFGYHIKDLNTIYLTKLSRPEVILIDSTAKVKERINFGITSDGLLINNSYSISMTYTPIIIIDNKMYLVSEANRWAERNPVSFTIDIHTKELDFLPFEYPVFPVSSDKTKRSSIESYLSRCFDGSNFIYSFHYDENIYVASPDHQSVRKIPVKSRYVRKVEFFELKTSGDPMKNTIESSNYGNLYFDSYRDVYYRVAYPKNEVGANDNFLELFNYGRKVFSVMILNRDFQVIGETLFPEYVYNPWVMFIREDGLYISGSHVKNPNYDDDWLTFDCFQLKTVE